MIPAARARPSSVPRREARTALVLVRGDTEVASWPLETEGLPDLSVVDELARLQLAAMRLGCSIRLRGAGGELWELLDLAGLAQIVRREGALLVEVGWEPEGGEEVGVEEGVEPGDPVA
jgi:hypothetical protein